ncbi:MAG: hypothetical protein BTM33_03675 [Synechococcus sp. Lanier]|nr:MAG: hypothetical protein BTM33_03675 [Synechococcus sp. Lanier]
MATNPEPALLLGGLPKQPVRSIEVVIVPVKRANKRRRLAMAMRMAMAMGMKTGNGRKKVG